MNKNGHWLLVAIGALFVAPCFYLVGELTDAPQGTRGARGNAGATATDAAAIGSGRSARGGGPDGGMPGDRRGLSTGEDGAAGAAGARGSRGVYAFSREGSTGDEGQVADASYRSGDPNFKDLPAEFFDPRDLAVLEEIIQLNGLTEESSSFDYDDGDGVLEPTELGEQVWCGTRLYGLRMGPDSFATFGYQVRELPDTLANLEFLKVLESNGTGLEQVPEAVGQMQSLERFSAFGNRVQTIPASLANAPKLEEIQLDGNQIQEIPQAIQRKSRLKGIFVNDNPIPQVPRVVVKQYEGLIKGSVVLSPRDLGAFGPDCRVL